MSTPVDIQTTTAKPRELGTLIVDTLPPTGGKHRVLGRRLGQQDVADLLGGIPDLRDAACRTADAELFFGRKGDTAKAKRICVGCPERAACLKYAREWDREHPGDYERMKGIWGGTSEADRRAMDAEEGQEGECVA